MALETATYITDLVSANPAGSDPKAQGDDHLRLLKAVLLATLPALSGAVLATHTEINRLVGVTSGVQAQIDAKVPTNGALGTPTSGTLTNCSGTAASLTAGQATAALGIKTATTTVVVSASTAPSANQILIASSSTLAAWGAMTLDKVGAAGAAATIGNGVHDIVWNWALTGAGDIGFTIGETSAGTSGAGAQDLHKIATAAASTANPLRVQTRAVDTILVGRLGDVTVTGLNGATGSGTTGSAVTVAAGQGASTSAGGALTITSGAGGATSGASGAVSVASGAATSGASGTAGLQSGNTATGTSGVVTVQSGTGTTSTGAVTIATGAGTSASGIATIQTGNASASGAASGAVNVTTGTATGGGAAASGIITLQSGNASDSAGNVVLQTGTGNSNGAINITTGVTTRGAASQNTINLTVGNNSNVSGTGGHLNLTSGAATSGTSGDITLTIGTGGGGQGKVNFVNVGVANAAVATTFGAVGCTGANAGNQLGWLAIKVGGTARFIPYW